MFIRAVFSRRRTQSMTGVDSTLPNDRPAGLSQKQDDDLHSPVRIIHKEQDSIAAFCLNKVCCLEQMQKQLRYA